MTTTPGKQVRRRRRALSLSQEALGRKTGLSAKTVQAIEADRGSPRLGTLRRIAKALGVGVEALVADQKVKV